MFPLGLLAEGETAEIVAVREGAECRCGGDVRTEDMGIRPGKIVEMLNRGGASGPVLLKVDESRIAIARMAAMKIFVRREQ
ncbi:MAG TPA: FeoA family protein [Verrucomicrobiae bacterium]|nr:FeoA family protein [Verrucomicrobiae bacterium]